MGKDLGKEIAHQVGVEALSCWEILIIFSDPQVPFANDAGVVSLSPQTLSNCSLLEREPYS